MSMVNFGSAVAAGVAGTSQSQRQTSAADGAVQDAAAHDRKLQSKDKAAKAEGVGSNEDPAGSSSEDRDADGRRAWEWILKNREEEQKHREKSIDTSGQVGNSLDISG